MNLDTIAQGLVDDLEQLERDQPPLPLKDNDPAGEGGIRDLFMELLVLACIVVGTLPAWSIGPVLALAAQPVVGGALPDYSLAVWHGFNTPLVMSLLATVGGLLVYLRFARAFKQRRGRGAPGMMGLDGKRLFENAVAQSSWTRPRVAAVAQMVPLYP